MIPYILIFIFCVFMFFLNIKTHSEKTKHILEIITIIVLILFSGTRFEIGGSDYFVYKKIYNNVLPIFGTPFLQYIENINKISIEPGFYVLSSFVKSFSFGFEIFTLIHSIIFYSLMYKALKKYNLNFNFFIIIFLYKLFFYNTFISLRQSIALVIFWMSLKYLINRKFIKYMCCCILGVLFHTASLILIPIYYLYNIKFKKRTLIILGIICFGLFLVSYLNIWNINITNQLYNFFNNNDRMIEKVGTYFNGESSSLNLFHTLEFYLIFIIFISNFELIKNKTNSDEFRLIIDMLLCIMVIVSVLRKYEIITRIKDYFIIAYPFIFSTLIQSIKEKKNKWFVTLCVIAICAFGYFRFLINFDNGGLIPYKSYLFK